MWNVKVELYACLTDSGTFGAVARVLFIDFVRSSKIICIMMALAVNESTAQPAGVLYSSRFRVLQGDVWGPTGAFDQRACECKLDVITRCQSCTLRRVTDTIANGS